MGTNIAVILTNLLQIAFVCSDFKNISKLFYLHLKKIIITTEKDKTTF